MTPQRQIITKAGLVFVDELTSYELDTSALYGKHVAFVGESNGNRWIELDPFTGPIFDEEQQDTEEISRLFDEAEAKHAAYKEALEAAEAPAGASK